MRGRDVLALLSSFALFLPSQSLPNQVEHNSEPQKPSLAESIRRDVLHKLLKTVDHYRDADSKFNIEAFKQTIRLATEPDPDPEDLTRGLVTALKDTDAFKDAYDGIRDHDFKSYIASIFGDGDAPFGGDALALSPQRQFGASQWIRRRNTLSPPVCEESECTIPVDVSGGCSTLHSSVPLLEY